MTFVNDHLTISALPNWIIIAYATSPKGDSTGFNAIEDYIKPDSLRVDINSDAFIQAVPLKRLLDAVGELIKKDPLAYLCQQDDCPRCGEIRNSIQKITGR